MGAATIFPATVTTSTSANDFRPGSNLANGTGLNINERHEYPTFENSWVTASPGPDYFASAPAVTLIIDFGSDVTIDTFKTWAYVGGTDGELDQPRTVKIP